MDEEVLKAYLKAGDIAYRAKKFASEVVKPGIPILDAAEKIEGFIREEGGEPAFPLNLSINYVAAHRTPLADDPEIIPDDSVVKVDLGVHVDGYIADTAITLIFNDKYVRLGEVVKKALLKGLAAVRPGIRFKDVGRVIEKVIRRAGYRVIKNLSGHSLGQYVIHAGESIPNFKDPMSLGKFRAGRAYAMEPFGTDGKGWVREVKGSAQIYSLRSLEASRGLSEDEVKVIDYLLSTRKTLPFCERWLTHLFPELSALRETLQSLVNKKRLYAYPVLVEVNKGYVVQFEETFIVTEDGILVTTNPEVNSELESLKKG